MSKNTNYKSVDPASLTKAELDKIYYNVAAAITMRSRLKLNTRESVLKDKSDFFTAIDTAKKYYPNLFTKQGNLKRQGNVVNASNLQILLNIINTETVKQEVKRYEKMATGRELSSNKRFIRFVEDVKSGRNTHLTANFDEIYEEYKNHNRVNDYWVVIETHGYSEESLTLLLDGLDDILLKEARSKYDNDSNFKKQVDDTAIDLYQREQKDDFVGPPSKRSLSDYQKKVMADLYMEGK